MAAIATRWVIRPMTSAASDRSTTDSRAPTPKGRLVTPAVSTTEANDSTVASVHTCASSRRTGMPSSAARSERSAAARTAVPVSVRRSRTATAMIASGATIERAIRSFASKATRRPRRSNSNGGGIVRMAGPSPQARGSSSAAEREQLGQTERRHGQQQPWRTEEPSDDEHVGEQADRRGGGESGDDTDQPRHPDDRHQ